VVGGKIGVRRAMGGMYLYSSFLYIIQVLIYRTFRLSIISRSVRILIPVELIDRGMIVW
jgi:hypothetical protein